MSQKTWLAVAVVSVIVFKSLTSFGQRLIVDAFDAEIVGEKPSSFFEVTPPVKFFRGICTGEDQVLGCKASNEFSRDSERRHPVRLGYAYEIQLTEVTQLQYYLVTSQSKIGTNATPSYFSWDEDCPGENQLMPNGGFICPQLPVETVSWIDAKNFVAILNDCKEISSESPIYSGDPPILNDHFRKEIADLERCIDEKYQNGETVFDLPTDAEWEYAARANSVTPRYFDSELIWPFGFPVSDKEKDLKEYQNLFEMHVWGSKNSNHRTHPVASRKANNFGLHDVIGNVAELVNDWWSPNDHNRKTNPKGPQQGDQKFTKGGGFYETTYSITGHISYRSRVNIDSEFRSQGFRVVKRTKLVEQP